MAAAARSPSTSIAAGTSTMNTHTHHDRGRHDRGDTCGCPGCGRHACCSDSFSCPVCSRHTCCRPDCVSTARPECGSEARPLGPAARPPVCGSDTCACPGCGTDACACPDCRCPGSHDERRVVPGWRL